MSGKKNPTPEDIALFRQEAQVQKRIQQDKVLPPRPQHKMRQRQPLERQNQSLKRSAADFFFSDTYEANLPTAPLKFVQAGEDPYLAKQLRRGDFSPEMILDLHGYTQVNAKRELAAMLFACQQENIDCCSIMHGFGSGVLKQKIPHWLVQHPNVRAFHQAPKEWGGEAAILVLLRVQN